MMIICVHMHKHGCVGVCTCACVYMHVDNGREEPWVVVFRCLGPLF